MLSLQEATFAVATAGLLVGLIRVYQGHAQNKLAKRKLEAWDAQETERGGRVPDVGRGRARRDPSDRPPGHVR